jgi:hypothetical protein
MTDIETIDPWTELARAGQVPPVPEDTLLAARAAVRRAAYTETLRGKVVRARRRRVRFALAAGLVAASVAIGAVKVNLGDHELGVSPAAAAVLERAARAADAEADPAVRAGQYLRITLVEQRWGAQYGDGNQVLIGKDGRPATTEDRHTRTFWIPADVDADWVIREETKVLRYGTTDPRYRVGAEPARTWRQPSLSKHGSSAYLRTYDPDWYASLPRDPQKLMDAISRAAAGREGTGIAYDFEEVYSEVLRSGMAPADIRSALFTGLAETPGMVVEHGVTTLDGRSGVAIGARDSRFRMIFDSQTGRYLGERATDPSFPATPGLDADKTTWLTSVTRTVVDHAPTVR